jgi:hypothetical protein
MNKYKLNRKEMTEFLKRLQKGACTIYDMPKTEWNTFEYAKGIYRNEKFSFNQTEFDTYKRSHPWMGIIIICSVDDPSPHHDGEDVVDFSDL